MPSVCIVGLIIIILQATDNHLKLHTMKMRLLTGLAIALGVVLAISSCKKDKETTKIPVTGVNLNKTSIDLKVGDDFQLLASVLPEDATDKRVTWDSDDESVATVDDKGLVKAVKVGKTKITVYTQDGDFTKVCEVTVGTTSVPEPGPDPDPDPDPSLDLKLSRTSATIGVGEKLSLKPYIWSEYEKIWDDLAFESENPDVATVDADLNIIGHSAGTAKLTGTCHGEGLDLKAVFNVTVENTFTTFVEDIFVISGRGVVTTTKISSGVVRTNDKVRLLQVEDTYKNYNLTISQIEMLRKVVDYAEAGDNVGFMYVESPKLDKSAIGRGAAIFSPDTERLVAAKKVYGTFTITDRKTPVVAGYKPQFLCNNYDVSVTISDMRGADMLYPNETNYCIGFEVSEGRKLLCRLGQEISVRENGRTIGTFVVSDYEEATVKYEDVE